MPISQDTDHKYYGATAKYYDAAYKHDARLKDLDFWLEIAHKYQGPILEVACGTGRVLLPIARQGFTIDGLDFSPELLSILQDKLTNEPTELQERVNIHQGDMRQFSLGKKYRTLLVPFRPLQHLKTINDQIATFACLHKHLEDGGTLAFNVFYPNFQLLEQIGTEISEISWKDTEDPSLEVERFFVRKSLNKLAQYFEGEFIYRTSRNGALVKEERAPLTMSYYTYPQLQLLFAITGFDILEEYGSFDKKPIDICQEMIFVLRKT